MPGPEDTAPPVDDRTIGQILGLAEAAPMPQPGFAAMSDDLSSLVDPTTSEPAPPAGVRSTPQPPAEPDTSAAQHDPVVPQPGDPGQAEMAALNDQRKSIYDAQRSRYPGARQPRAPITPADADIVGPGLGNVTYESRIQIVDAWQYPGRLGPATPGWIDRNWVGYADDDPVRNIPSGPCLRVPSSADPAEVVMARIGDYVCRQQVLIDGGPPVLRVEVWAAEQFVRLFVPVPATPGRPPAARDTAGPVSGSPPAQARPQPEAGKKNVAGKKAGAAVTSSRQRKRGSPGVSRPAA